MIHLDFANEKITLRCPYDAEVVSICRGFPIRSWDNKNKIWEFPFSIENYEQLIKKLAFFSTDISAKLKAEYQKEKAEILKLKTIKESSDVKLSSKLSDKLYNFQRVGVGFLLLSSCSLLADSMGIGKSIQALCLCEEIKAKKILIICPNSLKWTWANEIEKWIPGNEIEVYQGKTLTLNHRFSVINYEALRAERNKNLQKTKWDVLIYDEQHRLKNRKTKVVKAAKKIKAERILGLTGTPVLNRTDELWSLLNILYPKRYSSYWRFFEKYVDYYEAPFGKIIRGSKNLDQLKKELEPIMIRRTKEEVLPDLPKKTYQNIIVELNKEQRRIYDEMRKDFITKLNEEERVMATVIIAQIIRLKQIAIHPSLLLDDYDKNLPSAKLKALFGIIEDTDKKIVVFSQFAKAINIIEKELKEKKIGFAKLTGDVKPEQRKIEIERFQSNKDCRIFIGTIQAGGVGITLTAADTVVFLDKLWTPGYNEQAEDRLHRIGQKNNVTVINLIAKDTIEERIENMLADKKHLAEVLLSKENIFKLF